MGVTVLRARVVEKREKLCQVGVGRTLFGYEGKEGPKQSVWPKGPLTQGLALRTGARPT
jgi:hypothetical protein